MTIKRIKELKILLDEIDRRRKLGNVGIVLEFIYWHISMEYGCLILNDLRERGLE